MLYALRTSVISLSALPSALTAMEQTTKCIFTGTERPYQAKGHPSPEGEHMAVTLTWSWTFLFYRLVELLPMISTISSYSPPAETRITGQSRLVLSEHNEPVSGTAGNLTCMDAHLPGSRSAYQVYCYPHRISADTATCNRFFGAIRRLGLLSPALPCFLACVHVCFARYI